MSGITSLTDEFHSLVRSQHFLNFFRKVLGKPQTNNLSTNEAWLKYAIINCNLQGKSLWQKNTSTVN